MNSNLLYEQILTKRRVLVEKYTETYEHFYIVNVNSDYLGYQFLSFVKEKKQKTNDYDDSLSKVIEGKIFFDLINKQFILKEKCKIIVKISRKEAVELINQYYK